MALIVMLDFLEPGSTINGQYYAEELEQLRDELKARRRGKLSKGILFLQDNASAHTSRVAVAAAGRCGFQLLPHPAYSPDLAPSDFFLFPAMKESLRGRHFGSNDEVIAAVDEFLEDKDEAFYRSGLLRLEHRWRKCIAAGGDYIET